MNFSNHKFKASGIIKNVKSKSVLTCQKLSRRSARFIISEIFHMEKSELERVTEFWLCPLGYIRVRCCIFYSYFSSVFSRK